MNNLRELLETASAPTEVRPVDVDADLRRGRRALHRRRAAVGGAAIAGLSVAAVVAVPFVGNDSGRPAASDNHATEETTAAAPDPAAGPFAAVPTDPDAFVGKQITLPFVPEGWEVQGDLPGGATIVLAPTDGSAPASEYDFEGKVVVSFEANPLGEKEFSVDGRTYSTSSDGGYVMLRRPVSAGEPASGRVVIQWPESAGWAPEDLIAYIDEVQVAADTVGMPG